MIYIFGSGPSGLFAAWACLKSGIGIDDIRILSKSRKEPKVLPCHYLHSMCGLDLQAHNLLEIVSPLYMDIKECAKLYSVKQYGKYYDANSIDRVGSHNKVSEIYNLSEALHILWGKFSERIQYFNVDSISTIRSYADRDDADLVISTIPINSIDSDREDAENSYLSVTSVVSYWDTNFTQNYIVYDCDDDKVIRYGSIFGTSFVEFNGSVKPTHPNMMVVHKISEAKKKLLDEEKIMFVGRYGAWDKSARVDTVYNDVCKRLGVQT